MYKKKLTDLTYGISCWGATSPSKLQKLFNIQKRCMRILFGEIISFDDPGFYETCARTRTYTEHKAAKDFTLEHTKPLFNKHDLLTLQNLYVQHTLCQLFKVLKYHSPISMLALTHSNPVSHHHNLIVPKVNLDVSKNNFLFSACSLWNKCAHKILSKPELNKRLNIIIPGSQVNTDLTCSIAVFKGRLKAILLSIQKSDDTNEWSKSNFLIS